MAAGLVAAVADLGERGRLNYAFADFIDPDGAGFAKRRGDASRSWVVCAESEEEAQRLASSSRMTFSLLRRGRLIQVPPPEKALRYLEEYGSESGGRRGIIGDPTRCAPASRRSRRPTAQTR